MTAATPLLDHCPPGLPRAAYTDPAWFGREQRTIWAKDWIYAGRLSDMAPGLLHRRQIAGHPVLLARTDTGIVAYHNLCRHRGAELCAADKTPVGAKLTCPYHAWSYATADGRLLSTGFGTPTAEFDRAAHGLLPVAAQVWNGLVFVSLAPRPQPLAPDPGPDALDNWPMDSLVTGHTLTRTLACNWKVFWENYNECLHCPGIHPELSRRVPVYAHGVMSAPEDARLPQDAPVLQAGAQSWTVSGRPCAPAFPGLTPQQQAEGHRFVTLYPSMFVVAHLDHVRIVSLIPMDATTCRLRAEWLFAPETLARPGFDLAHVTDFAATVLEQDALACEMNQRGIASPAFVRGTLMPQEFDLARFHAWLRDRLTQEETPK